jgi:hypothetical protein
MLFPVILGTNSDGGFRLPDDFGGAWNIIFIRSCHEHLNDIYTWLPLTRELIDLYPEVRQYQISVQTIHPPALSHSTPASEITFVPTVEIDIPAHVLCDVLDLPDSRYMYTLVIDHAGHILWAAEGALVSKRVAMDLREILTVLHTNLHPIGGALPERHGLTSTGTSLNKATL